MKSHQIKIFQLKTGLENDCDMPLSNVRARALRTRYRFFRLHFLSFVKSFGNSCTLFLIDVLN